MKSFTRSAVVVCSLLMIGVTGCGKSGSDPTLYPEVWFQVIPRGGEATFAVDFLDANTVRHAFPSGTVFTATSTFSFFLENAEPPYAGKFTRLGDVELDVILSVTGQTSVTDSTLGEGKPVAVVGTPTTEASTRSPEVRVDVCIPTSDTCSTSGDAGVFGVSYSGTAGDSFISHVLSGNAPGIYFIDGARDNVGAVVRSADGSRLQLQLYVNQVLREADASTKDAVVQQDL